MSQTVLITGISGYIGLHTAAAALQAGYQVRGSIRNKSKSEEVRATFAAASIDTTNLEFVEADLTKDAGWDDATRGCAFVLHVASPYALANPKSEDDMIIPAVEGTQRVLRAAAKAGVQRVVLTSSFLAMAGTMSTGTVGPEDWTDTSSTAINTYTKSKTLAERAAWDFVKGLSSADAMELVVVNPGGVFGPPLGRNVSGQTLTMVVQMLRGKMPMVPDMAFPMVDVRDVAKLHVAAMTHADAPGQRFIAALAEPKGFVEVAKMLKDAGYKGPSTRVAPDFLLRFMGLFDPDVKGMSGMLGMNLAADNSRTRELFDWTPMPFEQTVLDTAEKVSAAMA